MRLVLVAIVALVGGRLSAQEWDSDELILRRGDSNGDGFVNGSDLTHLSAWLYQGGSPPPCANEADVNDDGSFNISDVSFLSSWLYLGGPTPPAPGPYAYVCSTDAHALGCEDPPSACL